MKTLCWLGVIVGFSVLALAAWQGNIAVGALSLASGWLCVLTLRELADMREGDDD